MTLWMDARSNRGRSRWHWPAAALLLMISVLVAGCSSGSEEAGAGNSAEQLTLPEVTAVTLDNRPLRVVATTGVIGDVVAQVGRDMISLVTLIGPGLDPHSYEPGARDLAAVAEADVIFVNGWDLEEALVRSLETIGDDALIVPVSAGIQPLEFSDAGETAHDEDEDEHGHGSADPHVWFDVRNVAQWTRNVATVLGGLDPANAEAYERNAADYLAELDVLSAYIDEQLSGVPPEHRVMVTNHESLSYFAAAHEFQVIGTVIPGAGTLAEPSAGELATLIDAMTESRVCVLFSETTMSDTLARSVAAELDGCEQVRILPLYTGALGPPGGGADSYIGMMRANVDSIVAGLSAP